MCVSKCASLGQHVSTLVSPCVNRGVDVCQRGCLLSVLLVLAAVDDITSAAAAAAKGAATVATVVALVAFAASTAPGAAAVVVGSRRCLSVVSLTASAVVALLWLSVVVPHSFL